MRRTSPAPTGQALRTEKPDASNQNGQTNGSDGAGRLRQRRSAATAASPRLLSKPTLSPEKSRGAARSASVRTRERSARSDDATTWAHRILGAKNSLTAADARRVEDCVPVESSPTLEATCRSASRQREPPAEAEVRERAVQWHRQERTALSRATPDPRQGAPPLRCQAAVPDLRPPALGRPPSALRATACARPQGQRRVHRAAVPGPPPRGPSLRR